jgi:CRP-like cAMP-binding protein
VSVRKGELEVANLGMGACFGEISYLSRRRRSASVVALEPVRVLRVNAALLENASERCQIDFQRVFIRTLIQRLVDTTEALSRTR